MNRELCIERTNHAIDALEQKHFFKLVCGASLTDTQMIENLSFVFTLAGAHVIDLAPKADVIFAARRGIEKAQKMSFPGLTRESSHNNANSKLLDSRFRGNDIETQLIPPLLMASIQLDKDPHFRKVEVDYNSCDVCGACVKVCPTEAFQIKDKKFIYSIEKCYGCGICPSYCHVSALEMIDTKPTPIETLKEMLLLDIQAIEFHFGKNFQKLKEIWDDVQIHVGVGRDQHLHGNNPLLSFSIGSDLLSNEQIKDAAKLCYKLAGKGIILQCDGTPMSGGLEKKHKSNQIGYKKDNLSLEVAKIIEEENLPVYLQLSGGTNEKSSAMAIEAGINISGVAIGSYARKLLMPYLNNLDDKENLYNAVNIARSLVNSVGV